MQTLSLISVNQLFSLIHRALINVVLHITFIVYLAPVVPVAVYNDALMKPKLISALILVLKNLHLNGQLIYLSFAASFHPSKLVAPPVANNCTNFSLIVSPCISFLLLSFLFIRISRKPILQFNPYQPQPLAVQQPICVWIMRNCVQTIQPTIVLECEQIAFLFFIFYLFFIVVGMSRWKGLGAGETIQLLKWTRYNSKVYDSSTE